MAAPIEDDEAKVRDRRGKRARDAACRRRIVIAVHGEYWAADVCDALEQFAALPHPSGLAPDFGVDSGIEMERAPRGGSSAAKVSALPASSPRRSSFPESPAARATSDPVKFGAIVGSQPGQSGVVHQRGVVSGQDAAAHQNQLSHYLRVLGRSQQGQPRTPGIADQHRGKGGMRLEGAVQLRDLAIDRPSGLDGFEDPESFGEADSDRRHLPGRTGTAVHNRNPIGRRPVSGSHMAFDAGRARK